ncbi:MAG: T9SS type A sorting domain-containing protein, partial [Candidatus Marinimicrobia bacterium]|nr:T9SS type A sorting domain-containing protein [Candidatus Neomarinimicrobiota bacterium]
TCVCPNELSATFGPFAKGTYVLAFDACLPDYPTFQIGSGKATQEWNFISSHQSECYNINSTAPNLTRPESFTIRGIYPNPFNSSTTIRFDLPAKQFVTVSIFDLNGNLVQTLMRDELPAGDYFVRWDAKNHASGIYFVKLAGESTARMSKVVLVK